MGVLKTKVRNGRIVFDEPTNLPEGTELELVMADEGDDLDDAERELLHEQLRLSWQEAKEGKTVPADVVLNRLRSKA